jgi:hypothetical protein
MWATFVIFIKLPKVNNHAFAQSGHHVYHRHTWIAQRKGGNLGILKPFTFILFLFFKGHKCRFVLLQMSALQSSLPRWKSM